MKVEFGEGPICTNCKSGRARKSETDLTEYKCESCGVYFDWHPDGLSKDKCSICKSTNTEIDDDGYCSCGSCNQAWRLN